MPDEHDVTRLLQAVSNGQASPNELMQLVYADLHERAAAYMAREWPDHTLQPTALINEAYLKLIDQTRARYRDRSHFYALAAKQMRRVLKDHGRGKQRAKRGRGWKRVSGEGLAASSPAVDPVEINEALECLEAVDERRARIVELRFFGGLTEPEIATLLGVSLSTVQQGWRAARAWLKDQLSDPLEDDDR